MTFSPNVTENTQKLEEKNKQQNWIDEVNEWVRGTIEDEVHKRKAHTKQNNIINKNTLLRSTLHALLGVGLSESHKNNSETSKNDE